MKVDFRNFQTVSPIAEKALLKLEVRKSCLQIHRKCYWCILHSSIPQIYSHLKIFVKSIHNITLQYMWVILTKFFQKIVGENFFPSNQLLSYSFSKRVAFTKFLPKKKSVRRVNLRTHCGNFAIWLPRFFRKNSSN